MNKPSRTQIFEAFDYIHNKNNEGDIYLPSDVPHVVEDYESAHPEDGVWIRNCAVWLDFDEVRQALADKKLSTPD